ncbi:Cilia- and flagella-associated protein 58 [Amphibalanus amphitrite]|uniref:Cilia-and flagella-associated protein 58 n=1 Tax=Amphibalanus amphitrite TaxID=1232801 RepID=A0A6A4VKM4_AMPAM|nr:Cilia- and flagella-associated protein 58 [Amphibalanus amphitrite]
MFSEYSKANFNNTRNSSGREEEMAALRQEVARLGKLRDSLTRRLRAAEEQRSGLQAEMEASTATKYRLARDLEQGQRQADADKKTMDELRYERELLKKGMLKVQDLRRVSAEKEALQLDLEGHRVQAVAMKNKINEFESEHLKLNKVIANSEAERNKQRKDMNQIMTERDILGTQLVRRNDELALLYEKIRIQESTLSKGEQQYRERIKDIGLLKLEIKKLRREKSLLNRSVHNLEDMRREMYHMHRALLKERSKCNALENELQNPQNVHRWRRLEVQEKEKLYLSLKQILSRQPGPEVAEQLMLCQGSLRHKTRQMKAS